MNMLAFMPFFDPMYLLFMAPALLLAAWAQMRVTTAYHDGKQYAPRSGLSGAETAEHILRANGIHDVAVEGTPSFLGDHYDPQAKVLRLSPEVYRGRTLTAMGIAAHEVGHAIQHAAGYGPLSVRNVLVPVASLGSNMSWILIMIGLFMQSFGLAVMGVLLFGVVVLFQLFTLPVEFDASRRARAILLTNGMVTSDEDLIVGKVLNAAAWTYIAAALTALLQLLYFASLVFGGRRSD